MLTLDQALERIPGLDGALSPAPRPFEGGLTNLAWRISVNGKPHVLRLSDASNKNSDAIRNEVLVHRLAHRHGLAPEVVFVDEQAGILVTELAPGMPLNENDAESPTNLRRIGKLLGRVHCLPRIGEVLDLQVIAQTYARRCPRAEGESEAPDVLECLRETLAEIGERVLCVCHNDPVASNFIVGRNLVLIDWEFAALNDPMFDLAVVTAHHNVSDAGKLELLAGYGLSPSHPTAQKLAAWERVYRCLHWLWIAAGYQREPDDVNAKLQKLIAQIRFRPTSPTVP